MFRPHIYTIISTFVCLLLIVIFVAQFFRSEVFGIHLENPRDYSVLQLVALFYNILMILFMERIRLKGDFFVENSSDFFPCLSASCGILTSFWVLILVISLYNASYMFFQIGLFFLVCLIHTIVLLLSSCCRQIQYDNLIREIIVESSLDPKKMLRFSTDLSVNYQISMPKEIEDKSTTTENKELNVVELNNAESDKFLKVKKWADMLSKSQISEVEVSGVIEDMKNEYLNESKLKTDASSESSSSSASLISLIPENVLHKF